MIPVARMMQATGVPSAMLQEIRGSDHAQASDPRDGVPVQQFYFDV